MEYTEIKYVDVINGEDIIENGTESNPYHTISYCVSQLSTTNPLVYISSGSYTIDNILTLKVVGKTITYIGTGRDTIININNGILANQEGKFIIFSCVLTPSETSTMSYIIGRDNYPYGTKDVKDWYYNVAFLSREKYPSVFFGGNVKLYPMTHLGFFNCSFIGARCGINTSNTIQHCAVTQSSPVYGDERMLLNCTFNDDYLISDETGVGAEINNTYGVYSGDYAWMALLLKQDGKYYSIYDKFYNITNAEYTPLQSCDFTYQFSLSKLFDTVTIGLETFKPIDKFDDFSIVLPVVRANNIVNINAIKSNKELIVQSFDINTSLIDNINSLIAIVDIPENSNIKFVFSSDMGDTWMTIIDREVIETDCVIPKKRYQEFTNEDELYFNAAKETIDEVGFASDVLLTFDWNSLDLEKLRFAYVFTTDKYINNPSMQKLAINYDEKGFMQEMKDSECDIEVFDHTVKVKSNISNPLIEADIII